MLLGFLHLLPDNIQQLQQLVQDDGQIGRQLVAVLLLLLLLYCGTESGIARQLHVFLRQFYAVLEQLLKVCGGFLFEPVQLSIEQGQ